MGASSSVTHTSPPASANSIKSDETKESPSVLPAVPLGTHSTAITKKSSVRALRTTAKWTSVGLQRETSNRWNLVSLQQEKVAVIGAGAFGTAMATLAARNGHVVYLYARDAAQAATINETHRNPKYLSDFILPDNLRAVTNAPEALKDASIIILTLPVQTVPDWLRDNKQMIDQKTLICNTAKGLYLKEKKLLSEAVTDVLGKQQPYAVISGPSFAKEIMQNMPTALVVASRNLSHAETVQRILASNMFLVNTSQDMVGVELGGALKNPLAIGAGMIQGSGFGSNTLSAYVTLASLELQHLCRAMGGDPSTICGLAGTGDLVLTAFGDLSRNRNLGKRLATGEKLENLTAEMTVEGVPTAFVVVYFADKYDLDVPIFRAVAAVLDGRLEAQVATLHLLGKPLEELNRRKSSRIYVGPSGKAHADPK